MERLSTMVLRLLFSEEKAQMLVEYALILLVVALVAVASLHLLGGNSNNSLNNSVQRFP
jgi:Flp pilus assembly pilin Flp